MRKEAADHEKKLHQVMLRTAEDEEKAKKDIWEIRKKMAQKESDNADLQKKKLEAEHFTALVKRNIAIIQYNQLAGNTNSIPVPPLPNIN